MLLLTFCITDVPVIQKTFGLIKFFKKSSYEYPGSESVRGRANHRSRHTSGDVERDRGGRCGSPGYSIFTTATMAVHAPLVLRSVRVPQ